MEPPATSLRQPSDERSELEFCRKTRIRATTSRASMPGPQARHFDATTALRRRVPTANKFLAAISAVRRRDLVRARTGRTLRTNSRAEKDHRRGNEHQGFAFAPRSFRFLLASPDMSKDSKNLVMRHPRGGGGGGGVTICRTNGFFRIWCAEEIPGQWRGFPHLYSIDSER